MYRPVPSAPSQKDWTGWKLPGGAYLIASPEKALADKIRDERGLGIRNIDQMAVHLVESLRIDEQMLLTARYRTRSNGSPPPTTPTSCRLLASAIRRIPDRRPAVNEAIAQMLSRYQPETATGPPTGPSGDLAGGGTAGPVEKQLLR